MFVRSQEKINYDNEHDVLYIFITPPRMAYEDEVFPGIFLRKDDDTDEVIGAIITDYKSFKTDHLSNIIPFNVNFDVINNKFIN